MPDSSPHISPEFVRQMLASEFQPPWDDVEDVFRAYLGLLEQLEAERSRKEELAAEADALEAKLAEMQEQLETQEAALWRIATATLEGLGVKQIPESELDSNPATESVVRSGADLRGPSGQPAADSVPTSAPPSIDSQLTDEDFEIIREDSSPAISPHEDPLGYIELDEHGMCPHDYAKGLGCHVCDPAIRPANQHPDKCPCYECFRKRAPVPASRYTTDPQPPLSERDLFPASRTDAEPDWQGEGPVKSVENVLVVLFGIGRRCVHVEHGVSYQEREPSA